MKTSMLAMLVLVLLAAAAPVASAQTVDAVAQIAGGMGNQYKCGTLNLTTGVFTENGSFGTTAIAGFAGLGANLYALESQGLDLYLVDIQNCTLTAVGETGHLNAFGGTTAALYAIGGGDVWSINPATGTATELGSTGLGFCNVSTAVAADQPATRMEYENEFQDVYLDFICDNGSGSILYQVSIVGGGGGFRVNEIGPTGVSSIEALVFVGGTLYATNAAGEEYTINTSNGMATPVTSTTQPITAMGVPASALRTLHTFSGGVDGGLPFAGVILDLAGNLFGTTAAGGTGACFYLNYEGCGTIFELKNHNGSWLFNPLYSFQGGTDGEFPVRPLTRGPNGTFYGTTLGGGEGTCSFNGASGCGVVFNAGPNPTPPRTPLLTFRESVLYRFTGASDGASPYSTVIFDQSGNMYGTTTAGGANGVGAVFELSPAGGGTYTETVLYSFTGTPPVGGNPLDGLIFDSVGNLYGTIESGGLGGLGAVFELSPAGGGTWTYNPIHLFNGNGQNPQAGVAMDASGGLHGTAQGGTPEGGVTWQLTSGAYGSWTQTNAENSFGYGRIVLDSSGNAYVTLQTGGVYGYGGVLKLTNDGNYIDLYDFTGASDGAYPYGGVVLDSSGNLYGVSESGAGTGCGGSGCGTVWKVTPTASY